MIFEIKGTGMSNKGAELMLCAIIRHLGRKPNKIQFVVEPWIGSYSERARYGLYQKMNIRKSGRAGFIIEKLMHRGYRQNFGLVSEFEIDVVLDASGFAFGDQWGPNNAVTMAKDVVRWKKQGKKIIFLPQAFGPFEDFELRRAFIQILEHADLVFARDKGSYHYIKDIGVPFDNVKMAPDFTNLLNGDDSCAIDKIKGRACIIPNNQMIVFAGSEQEKDYITFLSKSINYLMDSGKRPFILEHETEHDNKLVKIIQETCVMPPEIIQESDPLKIKSIIGNSFLVIGSRFHGLVNALSQGVPAIGTSWSHKYRYLFEDYSCSEYLFITLADTRSLKDKIYPISNEPYRSSLIRKLKAAGEIEKQKTKKMWKQVEELLIR